MKHTYELSGMTCNHCVQTVKTTLENIHGIQSAEVTLDPPQAVVEMYHHISTEEMNAALSEAGNYSLKLAGHAEHSSHKNHAQHEGHKMKDHSGHESHSGHEGHGGHNHHDHHRMMIEDFKKRFWVSLILTIPVLLLSPMIQNWLGVNWAFKGYEIYFVDVAGNKKEGKFMI